MNDILFCLENITWLTPTLESKVIEIERVLEFRKPWCNHRQNLVLEIPREYFSSLDISKYADIFD